MSTLEAVSTDKAPAALGPYSQGIVCGDLVFVSGQTPLIPGTKTLAGAGIEKQTEQALLNVAAVLKAAGLGMDRVIKVTVFLTNLEHFPTMNEIYARHFGEHKPTRSTVQVSALPMAADIEIECVAVR